MNECATKLLECVHSLSFTRVFCMVVWYWTLKPLLTYKLQTTTVRVATTDNNLIQQWTMSTKHQ